MRMQCAANSLFLRASLTRRPRPPVPRPTRPARHRRSLRLVEAVADSASGCGSAQRQRRTPRLRPERRQGGSARARPGARRPREGAASASQVSTICGEEDKSEATHLGVRDAEELTPGMPRLRRLGRARPLLPERSERVGRLDPRRRPPRAGAAPARAHRRRRRRGRRRRTADGGPRAAHDAPIVAEDDGVDADAEARVGNDVLEGRRDG